MGDQRQFVNNIVTRNVRVFGQGDEPAQVSGGSLIVGSLGFRNLNDGRSFTSSGESIDVADNGVFEILLVAPSEAEGIVNLSFGGSVGGDAKLEFYEGTTVSANGTALNIANFNRLSPKTAFTEVFSDPTVTDDGTRLLLERFVPGGTRRNADGATTGFDDQWRLAFDTNYLVRVTNQSGAPSTLALVVNFDELAKDSV